MSEMRFASSRGAAPQVSLSQAMAQGLAPDGGLYVPCQMPTIDVQSLTGRMPRCRKIARMQSAPDSSPETVCATELGGDCGRRAEFSRSSDAGDGRPRSAVCPGALSRPDRGIQGLWSAISGGVPAAAAVSRRRAAADHPGRDLGGYRGRSRGGLLSPRRGRGWSSSIPRDW